ncbi:gamma-glutamylcyclotransferase family protein [Denitromonas iodatirespirans]|uniref:Putative gamma-glutamylcyclotransferase n=1 Tax=Denitromonas iodatirespirans TaxID=2795389 RepID=A0A944D758_DENI1|nr:gamma-glutamylcyclotransferase family protein [Denitromonas iodatirespirans]MBT0961275.1 gamma-glutamylcyclotransferase [Denitromonas iodatirespirans]
MIRPTACFTYGSLMCEDIFRAVTGQPCRTEPAALAGYRRHPVRGEDYPGIRPAGDATVDGVLYHGVSPAALARLDAFEGAHYLREAVEVRTVGGAMVAAWVYVFHPAQAHRLAPGDWDAAAFKRHGKVRFLRRYRPTGRSDM